jgi:hypothetical protein
MSGLSMEMWMADPSGWRQLLPRATAHALHLLGEHMREAPASAAPLN